MDLAQAKQLDGLFLEAGGGWCSTVIMVPSLKKAPILATGRLHGPLEFVALAQDLLLFTCELIRVSVGASPPGCAGLHRSALRSHLIAARFRTFANSTTLLCMCVSRLLTECLLQ